MNQPQAIKTILTTHLDPHTRHLIDEAKRGNLHLVIIDEDGHKVAEVHPTTPGQSPDIWANYDPEAARLAWCQSAGTLKGIDVEALLADIKAAREQDSSSRPAP